MDEGGAGLADELLQSLAQNDARVNQSQSPPTTPADYQSNGDLENYSNPNNEAPQFEEQSYYGNDGAAAQYPTTENGATDASSSPLNDAYPEASPSTPSSGQLRPTSGPSRPSAYPLNRNTTTAGQIGAMSPSGRMTPSYAAASFGGRVLSGEGGAQSAPFGVRPPIGAQAQFQQRQGTLFQVPGRFATTAAAQRPNTPTSQLRQGQLPFQPGAAAATMNNGGRFGRSPMPPSRPSNVPLEMADNDVGPIGGGNQAVRLDSEVYVNPATNRNANNQPQPPSSFSRRPSMERQNNQRPSSHRRRDEEQYEDEYEDSLQDDENYSASQSSSYRNEDEDDHRHSRHRPGRTGRADERRRRRDEELEEQRYSERGGGASRYGAPRYPAHEGRYDSEYSNSVQEGEESLSNTSEADYRRDRRREGRRRTEDAYGGRNGRRGRERRSRYERELEDDDEELEDDDQAYEYETETFAQPRAPPRSTLTSRPPSHAPGADGLSEFNPPNAPTMGTDRSLAMRRLQLQEEQKRIADEETKRQQLELARRQQQQGQSNAAAAAASKQQDGAKDDTAAAKDQKEGKPGLLKSIFNQQNKIPIIVVSVTVAVALVIIGIMIVLSRKKKKEEEEQSSRSKKKQQQALPSSTAPIVPDQQTPTPDVSNPVMEYGSTVGGNEHAPAAPDFSYPSSSRDLPPLSNADFAPPQHSPPPSFQQQPQQPSSTTPYNPNIPQQQQQQQQQYYQERPAPAPYANRQPAAAQEHAYTSYDARQQDPRLNRQQQYNTARPQPHDSTATGNNGYTQQPHFTGRDSVHSPLNSQSKQLPVFD